MDLIKSLFGRGRDRPKSPADPPSVLPRGESGSSLEPEMAPAATVDAEPEILRPREVKARLDAGEDLLLVDVREDPEVEICRIDGAVHIPLGDIHARLAELPRDRPLVCYCHHGMRSEMAAYELLAAGFPRVANLAGGIHAWSAEVDPGMARY